MADLTSATPIRIDSAGTTPVLLTTEDMDRFVMTQRDVVAAALALQQSSEDAKKAGEHFGAFLYRLREWCKENRVAECVLSPRMDDVLVIVVAADEDEGGKLHDRMSQFDLQCFKDNRLRLSWLLLRRSERKGMSAFADLQAARTVYRGQQG